MPIIWLPYFQSADPTVKRKSGFLMPMYTQSDTLGTTVTVPYYFALSDHFDFTFAPMYTSEQGVLWQGSWRHRLASGGYRVDLAGVFNDGSFEFPKDIDNDFRGSIVTQGKFALNPYWSWGWDAIAESDDTFRRFYDLDSKLKTDRISQVYLEGLHDRNYASMRFYETGTLLRTQDPLADATVYPIVDYDYIFKNPIVGGELSFNSNIMALANADGTDSNRLIMQTAWRRQMIDRIGQVYTPFAQLRGDLYGVNEFADPATGLESSGALVRGTAVGGAEYRYPFIGTTGSVAHVFEPIAQVIGRPDSVGVDQSEIPNEDAKSLVFDDTILFDIDKFSGYDRIETGTRANVGLRYTAQLPSGAYARAVFGESYQLAGQNSFDDNTGLGTRSSDYVSGLYLQAARYLALVGQARFDQETFDLMRTDLGSSASFGPGRPVGELRRGCTGIGDARRHHAGDQERRSGAPAGNRRQGRFVPHRHVGAARQPPLRPAKRADDQRRRRRALPERLLDAGRDLRTEQHSGSRYRTRATGDGEFGAEISRHLSDSRPTLSAPSAPKRPTRTIRRREPASVPRPARGQPSTVVAYLNETRCTCIAAIAVLAVLVSLCGIAAPAFAQAEQSIVVLVNDDPITIYDVEQRQRFLAVTTQEQPSPALKKKATDMLIEERLQIQQGRKLGITPNEEDVTKVLAGMAKNNNMSPEQLGAALGQMGVNIKTLRDRIRAQVVWQDVVRKKFRRDVSIARFRGR